MVYLGVALSWVFNVYFYVLLARFVLELILGVNRNFRPKGIFLVIAEILMTITDPPLKLVRRILKPVRVGPVALDFSWTVLLFAFAILSNVVVDLFIGAK